MTGEATTDHSFATITIGIKADDAIDSQDDEVQQRYKETPTPTREPAPKPVPRDYSTEWDPIRWVLVLLQAIDYY